MTTSIQCGYCDTNNACLWMCHNCKVSDAFGVPMCEDCKLVHVKEKFFRGHKITPLTDCLPISSNLNRSVCTIHSEKQQTFYCQQCLVTGCELCDIIHRNHSCVSLQCAASFYGNKLRETIQFADDFGSKIMDDISVQVSRKEKLMTFESALHDELNASLSSMRNRLEVGINLAHDVLKNLFTTQCSSISLIISDLEQRLVIAQELKANANHVLSSQTVNNCNSDGEMIREGLKICQIATPLFEQEIKFANENDETDTFGQRIRLIRSAVAESILAMAVDMPLFVIEEEAVRVAPGLTPCLGLGQGSETGQLLNPGDAEIWHPQLITSTNPIVFVCDSNNNRVQVFDGVTGQVSAVIGRDQLQTPRGIALYQSPATGSSAVSSSSSSAAVPIATPQLSDCQVFVSDYFANRILVFNACTGDLLQQIPRKNNLTSSSTPVTTTPMKRPWGLCVWPVSPAVPWQHHKQQVNDSLPGVCKLFVADGANHRVLVYEAETGQCLQVMGTGKGAGPGELNGPCGLALFTGNKAVQDHLLYVADCCNHRVQVFDAVTGVYVRCIASGPGAEDGQLHSPIGLCVHAASNHSAPYLFVSDQGNHRVQAFNAITGEFVATVGHEGNNPGLLKNPWGVRVASFKDNSAELLITDCCNHRIQTITMLNGLF